MTEYAGFTVGDTVQITGEEFTGQTGELVEIDDRATDAGDFYGVYLDSVDSTVFFRADEIERA